LVAKVLIVDDALFMRNMLKEIFEAAGWQISGEAASGEEALQCYREHRPDLVMLDIVMPGMGGLSTLEALFNHDPQARIIVCSALGQKSLIMDAINAGASDFIVKPFKSEQVIEVAGRVFGG
jgi:two-component system chemotaxis response regulator CheY